MFYSHHMMQSARLYVKYDHSRHRIETALGRGYLTSTASRQRNNRIAMSAMVSCAWNMTIFTYSAIYVITFILYIYIPIYIPVYINYYFFYIYYMCYYIFYRYRYIITYNTIFCYTQIGAPLLSIMTLKICD